MKGEIEIWNEVMKDDLNKSIYNVGFQEGRTQTLREELDFLKNDLVFMNDVVGCDACIISKQRVQDRIKLISKLEDDEVKE